MKHDRRAARKITSSCLSKETVSYPGPRLQGPSLHHPLFSCVSPVVPFASVFCVCLSLLSFIVYVFGCSNPFWTTHFPWLHQPAHLLLIIPSVCTISTLALRCLLTRSISLPTSHKRHGLLVTKKHNQRCFLRLNFLDNCYFPCFRTLLNPVCRSTPPSLGLQPPACQSLFHHLSHYSSLTCAINLTHKSKSVCVLLPDQTIIGHNKQRWTAQ